MNISDTTNNLVDQLKKLNMRIPSANFTTDLSNLLKSLEGLEVAINSKPAIEIDKIKDELERLEKSIDNVNIDDLESLIAESLNSLQDFKQRIITLYDELESNEEQIDALNDEEISRTNFEEDLQLLKEAKERIERYEKKVEPYWVIYINESELILIDKM